MIISMYIIIMISPRAEPASAERSAADSRVPSVDGPAELLRR